MTLISAFRFHLKQQVQGARKELTGASHAGYIFKTEIISFDYRN